MNKLYFSIAISCLLVVGSCKKTQIDNETTSSTDFALVSQEFMQILPGINERAVAEKGLYKLSSPGNSPFSVCMIDSLSGDTTHDAQGVFTNAANLPVMWLQYSNCTGADGKLRSGTIKVSFTKKYNVIGSVATATLVNYSVNGVSCQGTLTIVRNSANSFTYNVANGVFTNNSWTSKYSCSTIVTLFDNGTPGTLNDDYVQVLGNANGTSREGKNYDVTISESLKKRMDCPWISQGIAKLTPTELHTRTIDFGNGNCDDVAAFVIDSQTFTIHLSK